MEGGQNIGIDCGKRSERVRSAKVFVGLRSYLHRALSLLYPIECPSKGDNDASNEACSMQENQSTTENTDSVEKEDEAVDVPVEDVSQELETEESSTHEVDDLISTRPKRKATLVARKKIEDWLNSERNMFVWGVSQMARITRIYEVIDDVTF